MYDVAGGPLQKCAHIKYFVAAGSFYTLAYVMVNLYLVGIITTIEKRFGFSSSSSGMLLSIKELAMVCSTLLMTHLARNVHKPRFLAVMVSKHNFKHGYSLFLFAIVDEVQEINSCTTLISIDFTKKS